MFLYKKYLQDILEENKDLVKEYAVKLGVLKEESGETYIDIEKRCYRVLSEYDRLIVYGINGEHKILSRLYEFFKDDSRVQFWLSDSMNDVLPMDGSNVWIQSGNTVNPYYQPIFDYGDYRLQDKAQTINKFILIDDYLQTDETFGFVSGEKKERNLCKLVSKFIKEEKEVTIFSLDEKSLVYIKGMMKGAGITNTKLTFALLDGYQNHMIQSLKSDMYIISPIVTIEEDRNWTILRRRMNEYKNQMVSELRKIKNEK